MSLKECECGCGLFKKSKEDPLMEQKAKAFDELLPTLREINKLLRDLFLHQKPYSVRLKETIQKFITL